jgi:hypothetical protein
MTLTLNDSVPESCHLSSRSTFPSCMLHVNILTSTAAPTDRATGKCEDSNTRSTAYILLFCWGKEGEEKKHRSSSRKVHIRRTYCNWKVSIIPVNNKVHDCTMGVDFSCPLHLNSTNFKGQFIF